MRLCNVSGRLDAVDLLSMTRRVFYAHLVIRFGLVGGVMVWCFKHQKSNMLGFCRCV